MSRSTHPWGIGHDASRRRIKRRDTPAQREEGFAQKNMKHKRGRTTRQIATIALGLLVERAIDIALAAMQIGLDGGLTGAAIKVILILVYAIARRVRSWQKKPDDPGSTPGSFLWAPVQISS